ncbi:unnamed protein product [Adineta ricciae]|uniref:Uncharacterized protein n=1 Tax=Adineta ricciae TaxID=249248 RepID=A0A814YKQ5_ADIRI|nr:unnamed protein product [Adineta ricciae]
MFRGCSSRQRDSMLAQGTTQVLSTNMKDNEFDTVNKKVKATTGTHEAMESAQELLKTIEVLKLIVSI